MNDGARRQLGRLLGIAIVAGAIMTSLWAWAVTYRHPRTDDAAVRANIVGIAPDVSAHVAAARAAVRSAELDVEYCRVVAPFDAYVTNLNIAVGQYAREGQEVFALVDDREWWVMANFRETYVRNIRPGAEADVFL